VPLRKATFETSGRNEKRDSGVCIIFEECDGDIIRRFPTARTGESTFG
jgi:hypothetical protein